MPIRFTRIVRTGLSSTVSTPAIAAQWTTCVAPRRELVHRVGVEHVGLVEGEVRVLGQRRAGERVAVEIVCRDDLVSVDEAAGKRRSDEPGATGDEDPLALEHAASVSPRYRVTRCGSGSSSPSLAVVVGLWRRSLELGDVTSTDSADEVLVGSGRGTAEMQRWTLRCAPAAGTLPTPARACVRLNAMENPFAPLQKDMQCTQIYGGPQEAVISGTFRGDRIWVKLTAATAARSRAAKKLAFLVPGIGRRGLRSGSRRPGGDAADTHRARRDNRPLRRRRAPPAPCDPAREGARIPRRRRRPEPRRARAPGRGRRRGGRLHRRRRA